MKRIIIITLIALIIASLFTVLVLGAAPTILEDGTVILAQIPRKKEKEQPVKTYYLPKPNVIRSDGAVELTEDEYNLLYNVVCLEAGGEGEDLQRAVTEVIYNRLLSGLWGSSVSEVIYSPNQFAVVPYLWTAAPSDLTKEIVNDVFAGNVSIPAGVLYFRTNYYHNWNGCKPSFQIGNVFFSEVSR